MVNSRNVPRPTSRLSAITSERNFCVSRRDSAPCIKRAHDIRFTLAEIGELLSLGINPKRERTEVRGLAQAKIADIDNKIRTLKAMETALQHLTERCSGCGPSSECLILASIDSEEVLR